MLDKWHTRQTLQHFGQTAFHSGAFAGSHHNHIHGKKRIQTHDDLSQTARKGHLALSSIIARQKALRPVRAQDGPEFGNG
jgi:hypothetical protein